MKEVESFQIKSLLLLSNILGDGGSLSLEPCNFFDLTSSYPLKYLQAGI